MVGLGRGSALLCVSFVTLAVTYGGWHYCHKGQDSSSDHAKTSPKEKSGLKNDAPSTGAAGTADDTVSGGKRTGDDGSLSDAKNGDSPAGPGFVKAKFLGADSDAPGAVAQGEEGDVESDAAIDLDALAQGIGGKNVKLEDVKSNSKSASNNPRPQISELVKKGGGVSEILNAGYTLRELKTFILENKGVKLADVKLYFDAKKISAHDAITELLAATYTVPELLDVGFTIHQLFELLDSNKLSLSDLRQADKTRMTELLNQLGNAGKTFKELKGEGFIFSEIISMEVCAQKDLKLLKELWQVFGVETNEALAWPTWENVGFRLPDSVSAGILSHDRG